LNSELLHEVAPMITMTRQMKRRAMDAMYHESAP
jgi:hypothetical protein